MRSRTSSRRRAGPRYRSRAASVAARPGSARRDHAVGAQDHTPNGTLEILNITTSGLAFAARVPVGLEPVAVAARDNTEVWVVNHLSDSVSVVTLTGTPHVTRMRLVGDEPRDIVFAGTSNLAFITTAHRGQQRTDSSIASVPGAGDPQLTTASVSRADVWVFNPASFVPSGSGTALSDAQLRALASTAGQEVTFTAVPPGSGARVATIL